jgi:4-azaleucine resistance transporter AzlC
LETPRTEFLNGIKACLPLAFGVLPFALISGVAAINAGLSFGAALGMSVIVFAGSAQLVAVQLIGSSAPVLVTILSACIVNLRFMMYSASLAPYLKHVSPRWKWLLSYLLTDQAYALTITRFSEQRASSYTHWYFFGAGLALWITWQLGTIVGVVLGAQIPDSWSLDFTIPLTFLALVVPAIKDRAVAAAAVTAGLTALAAATLPYRMGLITAALLGIVVGLVVEWRK